MKKAALIITAVVFAFGLCLPAAVSAAADVQNQIEMLQKQMSDMQGKMQDLQKQLEKAQQEAGMAQQRAEKAAQEAEEKVAEVAGKASIIENLQKKFGHLKFGGYVRSRWWDGQDQQTSFDVTEIAFNLRYDVSENISGEFHLWWHPSRNAGDQGTFRRYRGWAGPTVFFESAFAEFRNINLGPINGKLLVGKARNWAFGITPAGGPRGRVTSDYGLFYRSLSQSRITGIQYLTTWNKFSANFAVFNGWSLAGWGSTRNAGDVRTNDWNDAKAVRLLRTGQMNLDDNNNKAFSARLGYDPIKSLKLGLSFFTQELSTNDLAVFNNIMGRDLLGTITTDDDHVLYGADLTFEKWDFVLKAEYIQGEVADMDARWWYLIAGYKVPMLKCDFYLRYAQADYDQHRVASMSGSGAWDKRQLTPLIIYHLHPRAKLYFEYYFNFEENPRGTHHVDDNYGFIELILFY